VAARELAVGLEHVEVWIRGGALHDPPALLRSHGVYCTLLFQGA
jgi:hypothetical protein